MPLEMKYFVLKPKSKFAGDPYAKAARLAMRAYATAIEEVDPEMAKDLKQWQKKERDKNIDLEIEQDKS